MNASTYKKIITMFCAMILISTTTMIANAEEKIIRVGIIGLDTSHAPAFTKLMNDPNAPPELSGCRVVAAYPKGSPDIPKCVERVPLYTKQVKELGVEIVPSIAALLGKVDVVMLETQDGRPHLEQVLPVLKAGKTVFVDKPVAASLAETVAIYEAARKYKTPIFSSSSLRYMAGIKPIQDGKIGDVIECFGFSPCPLEKTHPDLFWYGIHGVEIVCTVMGTGCESVVRVSTETTDTVVGSWANGRTGTFMGRRKPGNGYRGGYGGIVLGTKGNLDLGKYSGYAPLVVEIVKFFKTNKPPVSEAATLEIYAFMEAADESKRRGGKRVTIKEVMDKARAEATFE